MTKEDRIEFEILPDGSIKVLTEGVSGVNHRNADELLAFVAKLAGGETTVEKRKDAHAHTHVRRGITHSH